MHATSQAPVTRAPCGHVIRWVACPRCGTTFAEPCLGCYGGFDGYTATYCSEECVRRALPDVIGRRR